MSDDKQKQNKKPHRWQPGESGNPKGRPRKEKCITSIIKTMLNESADLPTDAPASTKGMTWAQYIAYNMIKASAIPSPSVLSEFLNRLEGRVPQPLVGQEGGPIEVDIDGKPKLISALNRIAARAREAEDSKQSES